MATQVAGGANVGKALNLTGSSDANQNAELGAFDNSIKIDQANNAAELAGQQQSQQETTALTSLAAKAAAGTAA